MDEQLQKTFYYYVLLEPWSNAEVTERNFFEWSKNHQSEIRYIGVTLSPEKRFMRHLREFRNSKKITHKICWGRKLILAGKLPKMKIIKIGYYPCDIGMKKEVGLIFFARKIGCRLTNETNGGEGIVNPSGRLRTIRRFSRLGTKRSDESKTKQALSMIGFRHTQKSRDKIRIAKMGAHNPRYGKPGTMLGKHHSEESRRKISSAGMGNINKKGKHVSIECRKAVSISLSGRKLPQVTRDKISKIQSKRVRRIGSNEIYNSAKTASMILGKDRSAISHSIVKKCRCDGSYWEYVNE